MKIGVIGNLSGFGGAQTACRRLVEFFLVEGHFVGLVAIAGPGELPAVAKRCALVTAIEAQPKSRWVKHAHVLRAAIEVRRFRPNLLVTVGLARSSCLIARLLPTSTYCIAQDFIFGRSLADPILKCTNRAFDALAVQSPSMIDSLAQKGYRGLPLGWLPCFPDPPERGFLRGNVRRSGEIRLAYFGRLAANKGLDILLNATATAQTTIPVSIDIWGGGPELESLRKLSRRLCLDPRVRFCGHYPSGVDYAKLICGYDGIVLPSTGVEGLPLILLEAMSYGLPFLTTDIGAIPDACAENPGAVMVDPSVSGIRNGLEMFVTKSVSGELLPGRIRTHYQGLFSYDAMASRWRKMLRDPVTFFSSCN